MIAFEDLAVYFTWEEWQNMNQAQKILYRDVMLETYSSLFSLGHCMTKPDLIFKLEQGAEPWMGEECLHQSLPVAMKLDELIKTNQKSLEKNLNQNVMKNNNTLTPKRVEFRKTLNLSISHIPKLSIKKRNYSGIKSEECSVCQNVYPHCGPDQLQAGEKFDATKAPGNTLQFCEPLNEQHKIQTMEQALEQIGQGKVFKRKNIFYGSEKLFMVETCNKPTATIGKTTEILQDFHKKSNLSIHQQSPKRENVYKYIGPVEPVIYQSYVRMNHRPNIEKESYACKTCGKSFTNKFCHPLHHSTHIVENPHVCNDCGETTHQKSGVIRHQRIHTGLKSYKCNDCGKFFGHKSHLINHQRIHTGEKPYECNDCGKAFGQKSILIIHQRSHTGEKPYECNDCGKAFGRKSILIIHQRSHTGERPYECNDCGKAFGQKSNLRKHQRSHRGDKPYECNDCGKAFGQKSNLRKHQRSHTGDKPYECNHCGKAFGQKSYLVNHQRIHTGEKPYECSDCGKTFGQKSNLINHQRIHTGEKPYECNDCGNAFSQKSALTNHQRSHTGEKPYECSDCGKIFGQKSNLRTHQRSHTMEKAYK
ncbi:zinc finger protein 717-like [Lepus europaeus]|uniref:zinc finger protein 717-like n=1 Tax=Lepus europaeus TaxID=9983 RepID=UPI002B4A768E|nr:zinc finger protein 717-like [Lepus europaeus]